MTPATETLYRFRKATWDRPWWAIPDGGGFPPWWSWALGPPPLGTAKPWPSEWSRRPHP